MRITNTMMTNSMLTRINNNMNNLDKYYIQMSSQKKIQMPSEDPIIASRALRFRSIVSSTEQYSSNVTQANSWMEISESAYKNINSIYTRMSELCVQGATDSYSLDERKKVLKEFNSLVGQLEGELNTTYMGRYVFSGYKTNTPVIKQDAATGKNVLNSKIYGVDIVTDDYVDQIKADTVATVNDISKRIAEVNGKIAAGTTASLEKERDELISSLNGYLNIEVSEDKNTITVQGETIVNGTTSNNISVSNTDKEVSIKLRATTLDTENLYGDLREATILTGIDGQEIEIEVGVNNYIKINSLATNFYTQDIYDTLHEFDRIYDYMEGTLSNEDIDSYFGGVPFSEMSESEKIKFDTNLRANIESMITKISDFSTTATEQHTNLGVRMNRLSLIGGRLADDKVSYNKLMSDNENVNLADAAMNFNVANACYNASLRVGMTITQLTLADYL